jgi:hypothetical protein
MEAHTKLLVISTVFFELQSKYCDIFMEYNAHRCLLENKRRQKQDRIYILLIVR